MFLFLLVCSFCLSSVFAQECTITQNVTLSGDLNSTLCGVSLCGLPANLQQGIFGVPGIASCTISVNTTLTNDLFCNNLVISPGATLFSNGYRIFASGTMTVFGTVSNDGNVGQGGGSAPGTNQGTIGAGSSGGSGAISSQNGSPVNGVSPVNGINTGGQGGGSPGGGGLGGFVTVSPSGKYTLQNYVYYTTLRDLNTTLFGGGSGGGSGSINFGASGGGGGGGGVIGIYARKFTGTGSISANGGMGANGFTGDAGGGGGGGGGLIFIVTGEDTFSGSIQVNGGTGGTGVGGGGSGIAGQSGYFQIVVLYGF